MKAKSLWFLVGLVALVACGGDSEDFAPAALPETGIVDLTAIPDGTYKIVKVQSTTLAPKFKASASFTHVFAIPGDPEDNDKTSYKFDRGSVPVSQVLKLPVDLNLPFVMGVTAGKLEFSDKHYYWQYVKTDDTWKWNSSGSTSTSGEEYYEVYVTSARESEAKPVFTGPLGDRGAIQIEGTTVKLFYETTVSSSDAGDFKQIVVVTYQKS